jgi:arylsulfatase A-like enzyme
MVKICSLMAFFFFIIKCDTSINAHLKNRKRPPNLVFIVADDLGYGDVGFNGSIDIPTPHIDRIAQEGVKFTNGYVSWAACGPSRAGLITGRYQDRFGFGRNPLFAPNDSSMGLPLSEQTLPEVLSQVGYKSVAIGKWHLGAHPKQRPLKRGFSNFFGFLSGGHYYFPEELTLADEYEVTSQYEAYRTKLLRDNERIEETEYLTDALSREAVHYIHKFKDDPFFIYLAYNAPHAPLQATDKYLDRFKHVEDKKRRIYSAMVSAVDDGVGRVLDQLQELGIADNTMVVFISDNGGPIQNMTNNAPLRGYKGDLFEGGIRVPFAIKWPNKLKPGQIYEKPVSSLDIFATIVGQSKGIELKNKIDGVDLVPFITRKDGAAPHSALFWRKKDQQNAAVRKGDVKLIVAEKSELYNLEIDITEKNNIVENENGQHHDFLKLLEKWESEMLDPIFFGLNMNKEYDELHPDRFKRPEVKIE